MTDTITSYSCPYCRTTSSGANSTCPSCGAPVDVARRTTSGWIELPPIPEMTRVQLGQSRAQIVGKLVPAADIRLAAGEGVFFPGHNLLWQDPAVQVQAMSLRGAWDRMRAGLPVVMLEAEGPGTISFSHDSPGEMVVIPLMPGAAVDVREHQLVVATRGMVYDWYESGIWFSTRGEAGASSQAGGAGFLKMGMDMAGLDLGRREQQRDDEVTWHYPVGRYVDRFQAGDQPGAVLIQSGGNAFVRDLQDGESILVKPPALLFKDPTVAWQMHVEFPRAGMKFWRSWGNRYLWLRLWGPGRVALQSSYDRLEDPGTDFRDSCQFSQQVW
ncbi:MAG: AIM24 family protein [Acidimicrobiales bacterium]|nr:AIM24 family protein [Acidimicrobiales bacterium]